MNLQFRVRSGLQMCEGLAGLEGPPPRLHNHAAVDRRLQFPFTWRK